MKSIKKILYGLCLFFSLLIVFFFALYSKEKKEIEKKKTKNKETTKNQELEIGYFYQEFSTNTPSKSFSLRKKQTAKQKEQLLGIDVFGTLNNVDKVNKIISLMIEGKEYNFKISDSTQIFLLDNECNDLYTLCKDKKTASFKAYFVKDFFELPFNTGNEIRVFVDEKTKNTATPLAAQIIYKNNE